MDNTRENIIRKRVNHYGSLFRKSQDSLLSNNRFLYVRHKMTIVVPNALRALEKIADGSGQKCDDCFEEISDERLRVVPAAIRCIDCQRAWEGQNG